MVRVKSTYENAIKITSSIALSLTMVETVESKLTIEAVAELPTPYVKSCFENFEIELKSEFKIFLNKFLEASASAFAKWRFMVRITNTESIDLSTKRNRTNADKLTRSSPVNKLKKEKLILTPRFAEVLAINKPISNIANKSKNPKPLRRIV